MHCPIHFFAWWHAPCKRLARNESKHGQLQHNLLVSPRAKPTNIAEECASKLCAVVRPGPECIGMEWWLGRLKYGESLPFHTDRTAACKTDRANCPSVVVEYPVSEPIPSARPSSSIKCWPGGKSWYRRRPNRQVARRCSERVRGFSRRFTPWRGRQGSTTARPFQENAEVSRAAPDAVGQLLG